MSTITDSNLATVPTDSSELVAESSHSSSQGSFEAYLQARRAELQQKQQHEIEVPGYENLFGVYHNLDYKQIRSIQHRHEKRPETDQEIYGAADILINACDRLFGKGENDATVELPKWGVDLAKKFGVNTSGVETARQAVLAIFAGNELGLVLHAGAVVQAMQDTDKDVDEELAGE